MTDLTKPVVTLNTPTRARLGSVLNAALRVLGLLLLIEIAVRSGELLNAQLLGSVLPNNSGGFLSAFIGLAVVNLLFLVFESYEDKTRLTTKRFMACYGRGILFTFIFFAMALPAHTLGMHILGTSGLNPLIASAETMPLNIVSLFLAFFVMDFFYYWLHRAMHWSSTLWRFHAIHHSLEELTSWNGYHHWFEEYLRHFLVFIPTMMIIQPPPEKIFLMSAMLAAWGSYLHSGAQCLALPAPFRAFIADNVYHHYHHAIAPVHHDKNFAAYFPLWDRVFGTQYLPPSNEFPEVGIAGEASAQDLLDYIGRPFTKKS